MSRADPTTRRLVVHLDEAAYKKLIALAAREDRTITAQARVIIKEALGRES